MEIVGYLNKDIFYRVQEGESYQTISEKLFVSVEFIKRCNSCDKLRIGILLYFPFIGSKTYIVMPNDNLSSIAMKNSCMPEYIKEINNIGQVFAGEKIFL